jgi:Domain of unknown function (DUF1707)
MAGSTAAAVRFPRVVLGEAPVMTGPGDEIAAGEAGRGHLRASHADRENVIGTLKAAFVQGMLTKDELDLRVGQTLAARTYVELAALTADIPAGLTGSRPPQRARRPANKKAAAAVTWGGTVAFLGMLPVFQMTPDGSPFAIPVALIALVLYVTVPTGWLVLFAMWVNSRADRKSAHGLPPGGGGTASRRPLPAGPDRQIPPTRDHPRQTAEAAPIRRPRPLLSGWRPQATMGHLTHLA